MKTINIGHDVLKYQIIRKPIKNTYFRIKEDYIVITTNQYVSEQLIREHIVTNSVQFIKIISKHKHALDASKSLEIKLWGVTYQLYIKSGSRFSYTTDLLGIHVTSKSTDLKKIKQRIYDTELEKKLSQIRHDVLLVLSQFKLSERPYKLKFLISKFGSYHRRGDYITLNTFLASLDEKYLMYVLLHEYAHVIEFNHSARFYGLLQKMMPDYLKYHKGLKKMAIL